MTLVRFPGALQEFAGASPSFRLPIQTKASTTWLGDAAPKKEERAAAMEFQIDGWTEGQEVLTKEEVFALNKRMIMTDDPAAAGQQLWLGTPDRLRLLGNEDIGGILTLSTFQREYLGDQPEMEDQPESEKQTVIICSARPAGTKDGSKFLLHVPVPNPREDDTDPSGEVLRYQPSGFQSPKAMNPILTIASCNTRAPMMERVDDWYKAIGEDRLLFPRGDEVLQPLVFVFHKDEAPDPESPAATIIGGNDTLNATMETPLQYPHGETAILAYATERELTPDTTGLAPMGRCFFLPKNHGIPLAVAFHPENCRSGAAAFKNYCVEFTGLPEAVYQWMDDNPLLDMWLNGCYVSPDLVKVDTLFMSQVADTWTDWKGLESQAAFDTFRHPELVLRSRLLWDHLLHTLDGHWPDKLQQLGSHAMTIFDQSPDIAPFHSTRMDDMWYLPGLLNIKTQSWIKNFEIAFQKTDLPAWLNEFVRVDIAATLSVEGLAQLKIVSKHTQAKELTPAHNKQAARRPPPTALLSAMIRDRFQSEATSPIHVKQHESQQSAATAKHHTPNDELDWQRRDRKRKQGGGPSVATQLDYRKHGHWEDSDDSVEVTGVRKPPTHPATPPRVQQRQRNRVATDSLSTSGLHLPFEQIRTGITPYFPGHAQTTREPVGYCLLPTVDDIDDPFMFNRTKYVVGTLNATMGLLAHFGAYAVPPTIRMGPTTEEARESVYENYVMLLPGIISKAYCVNVLAGKGQGDPQQASLFFANDLEAATHSTFPTYFRPSFESDTFYRGSEQVKAIQSGAICTGEFFRISTINGGVTPFHFIPTVLGGIGYRLPNDGLSCTQMIQLIRNIGWWLHLVFHFPSRYKNLRDISAELSPFLLASPLAGHLFWFIEHLSHHPTQQAWMRLRPALRLRVTAAAFIGLQHLFKVFTDWAQNYFPDEHCVPLLLWSYPERSDVCAFDSAIRMRDWKTLKDELTIWRSECEAAFNVNVFTSTADSPATFYSRPLPADVMPIRPPPVLHHQQQHQPPARPLHGHQQQGHQLPAHQPPNRPLHQAPADNGTYRKSPVALIKCVGQAEPTVAYIRQILNELTRQDIRVPVVNNAQICFPFIVAGMLGCNATTCRRCEINLRATPAQWTSLPPVGQLDRTEPCTAERNSRATEGNLHLC